MARVDMRRAMSPRRRWVVANRWRFVGSLEDFNWECCEVVVRRVVVRVRIVQRDDAVEAVGDDIEEGEEEDEDATGNELAAVDSAIEEFSVIRARA